jgi:hypothetical protein
MACGYHHVTARGVAHVRMGDRRKPFKWQLGLTSGPWPLFYFSRFLNTQTFKSEMVNFPMSKLLHILQVNCLKHKEQLFFVPTSKSQRIASYKFWDKFKFESSLNFKGIQTFL